MPSVKFARQTFSSPMVAGMTVAVMSRQKKKHVEIAKLKTENKSVSSFFRQSESSELSVIRTEMYFTSFLIEHNFPLACSDHTGHLFHCQ